MKVLSVLVVSVILQENEIFFVKSQSSCMYLCNGFFIFHFSFFLLIKPSTFFGAERLNWKRIGFYIGWVFHQKFSNNINPVKKCINNKSADPSCHIKGSRNSQLDHFININMQAHLQSCHQFTIPIPRCWWLILFTDNQNKL